MSTHPSMPNVPDLIPEDDLSPIEEILDAPPFEMNAEAKSRFFTQAISQLTLHHYDHSAEYRRISTLLGYNPSGRMSLEEMPYLPVRLFKEYDLISVDRRDVVKVLASSGTTGQVVSKVFLDRVTATHQTKALVHIVSSFTGAKRLPMLIVDSPAVVRDRELLSARGAGVLGFAMLGHDVTYMLNEKYEIEFERVAAFLEKHQGKKLLLFGFTFVIWEYLCQALRRAGRRLELDGVLVHGGGWKKLASLAVDNATFKKGVLEATGVSTVCNYYGMVEQTGSILMECSQGVQHASAFSDIIIRDPVTLSVLGTGQTGLVQSLSLLPTSYPGHSLLTDDLGEMVGVDDCPCGRKGKYFLIHGRQKNAEVRGCSDVYASH